MLTCNCCCFWNSSSCCSRAFCFSFLSCSSCANFANGRWRDVELWEGRNQVSGSTTVRVFSISFSPLLGTLPFHYTHSRMVVNWRLRACIDVNAYTQSHACMHTQMCAIFASKYPLHIRKHLVFQEKLYDATRTSSCPYLFLELLRALFLLL